MPEVGTLDPGYLCPLKAEGTVAGVHFLQYDADLKWHCRWCGARCRLGVWYDPLLIEDADLVRAHEQCHATRCPQQSTHRLWWWRAATSDWVGGIDYCQNHGNMIQANSTHKTCLRLIDGYSDDPLGEATRDAGP